MTLVRVQKLQLLAAAARLDAIAVVPGPNMRYFTSLIFHLSERPTVAFFPIEGIPVLVVPTLEEGKVRRAPYQVEAFTYDDAQGPVNAFNQALQALNLGGKKLGIEGRRMRFLELDLMAASNHAPHVTNADIIIAELRMRKDDTELAAMRHAVQIAQQALDAMLPAVKPGVTEKELAVELTLQLLRHGSDSELPFTPLVAAGPNAADPHGFPSTRPVKSGDVIIFDWGATADGYFSDITRTFAIGGAPVDPELLRAYQAVQAANQAGKEAAKPGATGQTVDRAARAVIEEAGFGPYFVHRTGHGLGMEIHEEPDMKAGSVVPLEPGMTFTVEPGIYLPNLGGIRIEDDVVITETGSESLTTLPRLLTTLG
ncbi:MAG: aminopeptidase P family protein [Anaerolineae bacterium]|nr:aminopeptidase P family protein [Anaerolineae bacterium]